MPYLVAWDETVPAGTTDARFLDDRMRDRMSAIRERFCDAFGGLTLLEFQADPILLKGIRGGGDADFDILGGTATSTIKNAAGTNNDLQVNHANGDTTLRRYVLAVGGFRSTLDGWSVGPVAANVAATEIVRTAGRTAMARAGSLLSVGVFANAGQLATAGNLTVTVWKSTINPANGVHTDTATALTAVLNVANPNFKLTTQAMDVVNFAAGDELFIKYSTDALWAPATISFRVIVEIAI